MDERTFNSLRTVLDWLQVGGYDEPTEDIHRVVQWVENIKASGHAPHEATIL